MHVKKSWMLAVFALGLWGTASAARADGDWYVAYDYGYSSIGVAGSGYNDPQNRGYRLAAGYNFDPTYSLEAGYMDFGRKIVNVCAVGESPPCVASANLKADAFALDGLAHLSLASRWTIFARLGVNRGRVQTDYPATQTSDSTGVDWGFGTDLRVFGSWRLRWQFARYQNFGNDSTGHGGVSLASVGFTYTF